MKGFFTFILFLAFAFRPIYNIGYVAYFELNIDYIIETYCVNKEKPELKCNGKCHLASKLAANSNENPNETSALASIIEAFVPLYFQEYKQHEYLQTVAISIKNNWNYINTFSSRSIDKISPPPWA